MVVHRAAVHVVGEAAPLAKLHEQAAAHPLAEHGVHHVHGVPVVRVRGGAVDGEADVRLIRLAVPYLHAHAAVIVREHRAHRQRLSRALVPEQRADAFDDLLVLDVPGHGDDRVRGDVLPCVVGGELLLRDAADGLARAAHIAPHRLVGPERVVDEQVGEGVRVVVGHRQLFEDDAALALDLVRHEQRGVVHVGEHVERDVEVVARDLGVVERGLAVGAGVEDAADGLDGAGDHLRLGALLRALEEHVLQEVGGPGDVVVLVPGPRADEDAGGDGADVRHGAGEHPEAVRQDSAFVQAILLESMLLRAVAGGQSAGVRAGRASADRPCRARARPAGGRSRPAAGTSPAGR